MKQISLLIQLTIIFISANAQNYVAIGDSCYKAKDYRCAAKNYDLFLEKIESHSNQIAYRSAKAWSITGDKDRAIAAVKLYVANQYENNYLFFHDELEKEKAFDVLKDDSRFKAILASVIAKETAIKQREKNKIDSNIAYQRSLEHKGMLEKLKLDQSSALATYRTIKAYNAYPVIGRELLSMQFKILDSLHTAFLVVLPKDYDPHKRYPLLFFLHGAVSSNTGYLDYRDERDTMGWNRFYTKYAKIHKVIMVYPSGNRDYNWMYPDKGFYMIPAILRQIKQIISIDDNRVFVTGHSNGATGSFSYLMKQPSPFAAFYGFNTRPRVATGGTYLRNILNRSYFNVSTDSDYYYPPEANDSLSATVKRLGADYQDHRYNGFPHWFPQFDESESAHKLLFADLATRKRNPFHPDIYWECDDIKYGRCDWMQIHALDTTGKPASWHRNINFPIKKWKEYGPKHQLITRDTLLNAFKYSKKSGAIKAHYSRNLFTVWTSDVRSFSLLLSPQMVDFSKPLTVIVNGKQYCKQMPRFDKDFMIKDFKKNADRSALWVSTINVTLH